jgi:hypothetical protein
VEKMRSPGGAETGEFKLDEAASPLAHNGPKHDYKAEAIRYDRQVVGLPATKQLDAVVAGTPGIPIMTWLNEIQRFMATTGQDSVFFIKNQLGVERSLLTHSGMYTIDDAKAHVEHLKTHGDSYDLQNMKTSGTAMLNSIGAKLHSYLQKFINGTLYGPIIFMLIVKQVQAGSASVWRSKVDQLR